MLSIDEFIAKVDKHPLSFFRYSLESIIDEHIAEVRDSLNHKFLWESNTLLIGDIQKTVKSIHKKRSFLWSVFSFFLPLDDKKESEKKKLRILLDEINTDQYRLKVEIEKNQEALLRVFKNLKYLEALKEKLSKNKFFLKEIDDKISIIKAYDIALSFREVNFIELKKIYEMINKGIK